MCDCRGQGEGEFTLVGAGEGQLLFFMVVGAGEGQFFIPFFFFDFEVKSELELQD